MSARKTCLSVADHGPAAGEINKSIVETFPRTRHHHRVSGARSAAAGLRQGTLASWPAFNAGCVLRVEIVFLILVEKKARRSRAFLFRSDPRSGADPYQAPSAFDRAGAVRPLDVSLVTDYGLDYAVSTLEQTECTEKIHARTHRDLRATRIEQATKG
jgi:hypothetical protein